MLYYRQFMEKALKPLETLFQRHGGYITRRQVDEAGLEPHVLTYSVEVGQSERVQRGVYRLVDAPLQNHEDLLEVSLRIPYGVVCLSSALAFHGLTTFIPKKIHLAVPQKRKPPKLEYPPLVIHYFSDSTYNYGIESYEVKGHSFKVYSIEKTLVDLFRLKEQTLFAEGLKNYLARRKPKADLRELLKAARVHRVEKRLRPLLEVMTYDTAS
jgi:predicted transcriptional regulator of viral defense system